MTGFIATGAARVGRLAGEARGTSLTSRALPAIERTVSDEPAPGSGRLTVLAPFDIGHDTVAELGRTIRGVAPVLHGQRLMVVATWRSMVPAAGLARAALPAGMVVVGARNWDREQQDRARRSAQQCVAIAQECGIDATFEVRCVVGGWAASIAAIVAECGADAVVLTRGRRARRLSGLLARAHARTGRPAPLLVVAG